MPTLRAGFRPIRSAPSNPSRARWNHLRCSSVRSPDIESRTPEPAGALPDRLVSDVVRSIAWGGNQRRGAARIELGGERYGGTRLVVEVDGDELRLRVDAPPGVDTDDLRARLAERFARRGLSLRDD